MISIKIRFENITTNKSNIDHPRKQLSHDSKKINPSTPSMLSCNNAKIILLPKLPSGHGDDSDKIPQRDLDSYYEIYDEGCRLYFFGKYQKAKEKFLKLHSRKNTVNTYLTYLIKTYRNLITQLMEKRDYKAAILESEELFKNCSNTTNTDIRTFNKLVKLYRYTDDKYDLTLKELKIDKQSGFEINSKHIEYVREVLKPKGYKLPKMSEEIRTNLQKRSYRVPRSLPYISIINNKISFKNIKDLPQLDHDIYRFKESTDGKRFICSSRSLKICLYDWDFNQLKYFDARKYAVDEYHLRELDLTADMTYYLFTYVDCVYILDQSFQLISSYEVPYKEGWEKRSGEINLSKVEDRYLESIKNLNLDTNASDEEIKKSFRRLAHLYHPDKNPDDPDAKNNFIRIRGAYEYLTGEDAVKAFIGYEDEEYWINTLNTTKFEIDGWEYEMNVTGGTGEDWIYGIGISECGSRIYLGCYSGKVYQIDQKGNVIKIYQIPKNED